MKSPSVLARALVQTLEPYTPGEQPQVRGLIKLNTNENPYPPAPQVLKAVRAAVDRRLRLYPNAASQPLRMRLAKLHRCSPENIIVGNGSDELLTLAVRTFVEPVLGPEAGSSHTLQFFTPSYSLYPVLGAAHGARNIAVALRGDYRLPGLRELRVDGEWDRDAALSLITTPNAPSGRAYRTAELSALCRWQKGVVVLDEAYVDFARENAASLALRFPHVLVARTFSKAFSLCFLRVGYLIGHPSLIAALDRVRDSYNVNGLGQIAALATLENLPYYRRRFREICRSRSRLSKELEKLGFEVFPSETNFILARPPFLGAAQWLEELKKQRVLVRWFKSPELREYLRITVGTDQEVNRLLSAARRILKSNKTASFNQSNSRRIG